MPDPDDQPGFVISIPRPTLPRLRPEAWVQVAAAALVVVLVLVFILGTHSFGTRFWLVVLILGVLRGAVAARHRLKPKRRRPRIPPASDS